MTFSKKDQNYNKKTSAQIQTQGLGSVWENPDRSFIPLNSSNSEWKRKSPQILRFFHSG